MNKIDKIYQAADDCKKFGFVEQYKKVRIGDLTKIRTGKLDANAASDDGKYPFFTCSREPLKISSYTYDCECVLVAGNGDLNVKYYQGKFDAYQRTYIIEENGEGSLYVPYLYYFMERYIEELRKQAIGGVIKYIKLENLTEALIPLPDIKIQKHIVFNLSKAKGLIDKRTEQIGELDTLIKARFVEMFGDPVENTLNWKKDRVESHIDLLLGYPFKSEEYVENGINICGGLIIMPQKIIWENCVHWSTTEGYEDYLLNADDIVMALDRPWISEGFKIAQVDKEHLPALLIQRTARIRAIDVNQTYLYWCFINGGFDKHSNVTGSLVPHISAKDIKSFEIMLPPIELQNQFADFVTQVDKLKVEVQKSLDELQTLFNSLMQQYFG